MSTFNEESKNNGPVVIMGAFWFCIPEDTDRNRTGPPKYKKYPAMKITLDILY